MPFSIHISKPATKKPMDERAKQVANMLENGIRAKEIACKMGVTVSVVRHIMRQHRLSSPTKRKDVPFSYDALYEHGLMGLSIRDFSKKTGHSINVICHFVMRDYGTGGLKNFMRVYKK